MSIIEEIRALDHKWEREYKEYEANFDAIQKEIHDLADDLRDIVGGINSERLRLRDQIKYLYVFLSKRKKREEVTPFEYKDEHSATFVPPEKIIDKHSAKYKEKSEMSTYEKVDELDKKFVSAINPLYRRKLKKDYMQQSKEYQKEKNLWTDCLRKCEEQKAYYAVATEIAKLYRVVLMTIRDTIQYTILPELDGINAFLYAEAVAEVVKDRVIDDSAFDKLTPVDIWQYEGSKAYGKHYVFVENAHDFYTMIVGYFTTPHLTNLLKENAATEQDKSDFDSMVGEWKKKSKALEDQKSKLESNVIYTEVKK